MGMVDWIRKIINHRETDIDNTGVESRVVKCATNIGTNMILVVVATVEPLLKSVRKRRKNTEKGGRTWTGFAIRGIARGLRRKTEVASG